MQKVLAGGTIFLISSYSFHVFRRDSTERRQRIHHFPTPFINASETEIDIIDFVGVSSYMEVGGKLTKEEIHLRKEKGLKL